MLTSNPFRTSLSICTLTIGMIATCGIAMWAQEAPKIHVGNVDLKGIPDDWTHHHLVFKDPGTAEDALRNGKYDEWFKIVNDPRYVMQQLKHDLPVHGNAADDVRRFEENRRAAKEAWSDEHNRRTERDRWGSEKLQPLQPAINKDWSMVLGSGATKVGAGMFPAKFNFSTTAAANCGNAATPDYVVYNTSAAGSATQASVVAYDNLYGGGTCTGQVPSVYWAFNTGGTVVTSVELSYTGTQVAYMQTPSSGSAQLVLLKWAKTPAGRTFTGSVSGTTITAPPGTLTSMDVGAVLSGGSIPAGDTIATVTSATAGTLTTVGTTASGTLTISADAGGPETLTSVGALSYHGCTAPCMTTLTLTGSGTRADTVSSPFYDYNNDVLYVGDSAGGLHKFTPVFNGTPAEVLTGGAPWAALGTTAVTSPVYESVSGNVFAGDASGYVYSVNATLGTVVKSFNVAVSPGIVDGPMIDATNHQLYVIAAADTNANNTGTVSTCLSGTAKGSCNGVINLPTTFTASTQFLESVIGVSTANTLYDGAFDNLYWTSGTGNLYSVGGNGANEPKLMETPITTAGIANTSIACTNAGGLPNCSDLRCANNIDNPMTSAAAAGSPVTEVVNSGIDYIFTSVAGSTMNPPTGCVGACVESWVVTTALTGATTAAGAGSTETGGTSGIIIDNTLSTAGASQIYFSTLSSANCTTSGALTSGGCAVQASQSAP